MVLASLNTSSDTPRVSGPRRTWRAREILQRDDAAGLGPLAPGLPRSATDCSPDTLVRVQSWRSSSRIATSLASAGLWSQACATLALNSPGSSARRGAASAARRICAQRSVFCAPCCFRRSGSSLQARRRPGGVLRHHLVAVGDQRLQRLAVGHRLISPSLSFGAVLPHLGLTSIFQQADAAPADVELEGLTDSLAEVGKVVVVVAAPRRRSRGPRARCWSEASAALEVTVSPVVAPGALMMPAAWIGLHSICTARPSGRARQQRHVDDQHQRHAQRRAAGVEMALDPVVGRVVAVLLQRLRGTLASAR